MTSCLIFQAVHKALIMRASFDEESLSDDNSTCSTESETLRIGNTDWGLCRRCTPMESCTET